MLLLMLLLLLLLLLQILMLLLISLLLLCRDGDVFCSKVIDLRTFLNVLLCCLLVCGCGGVESMCAPSS